MNLKTVNHPVFLEQTNNTKSNMTFVYEQDLRDSIQGKQAALDRLRHTFLSTVNHEMRTPLALIFQTLEILEDPRFGELAEDHLDAVAVLRRQAHKLGRMVESLTDVARFLSKQDTVKPVLASLKPVFDNVIPVIEFQARSKEITVVADIAANLPHFKLDVKQMEEVMQQLLENAIKFNKIGGMIKVSAYTEDQWVVVSVSDTGVGIKEDQLETIWELFEQDVDPLKRAQEGLGLGLVLVQYIIEAHSGTITIETMPGKGSTFTIKLPNRKK